MRPPDDDLSDSERKILTDVQEHGLHVVHVPADDEGPGFSYTVGLWHHYEQPEVIVFGMPEGVAHELLEVVADECDDGRRFRGGEKHDELLVGYAVRFVDVPDDRVAEHFGCAQWAYDGAAFPCVQLVWPDKDRRWPWQEGVRAGFRDGQPVLGPRDA